MGPQYLDNQHAGNPPICGFTALHRCDVCKEQVCDRERHHLVVFDRTVEVLHINIQH